MLTNYLEENGFEIKVSKNCIVARQAESFSFNNLYNKNITFIFADSYLGFIMTKDFRTVNPPVFFTHYFIRKDLTKLLNPIIKKSLVSDKKIEKRDFQLRIPRFDVI